MLSLLSSILLCVLVLWLLLGALQSLVYHWLRPTFHTINPAQANVFILIWLALPLISALLASYVLYSPGLAQWVVTEHCHTDQCSMHGPQSTLATLPALLFTGWAIYSVIRCWVQQWLPAQKLCNHLAHMGDDCGDFVTLASAQPTAFTLGWFKPRVFISAGMHSACSQQDIDCILHHEAAHQQRRDNFRLLVGRLVTAPYPQHWVALALKDMKLSCEKACDIRAAEIVSREAVAAAIIRVTRVQHHTPNTGLAFAGSEAEQRIHALLAEPLAPLANKKVLVAASVTLLFILAMINPLHRAIELTP